MEQMKPPSLLNIRQQALLVVLFIVFDQGIKLVIWNFFREVDRQLFSAVYLWPVLNIHKTFFGSLGIAVFRSRLFVAVFEVLVLWLTYRTYQYLFRCLKTGTKWIQFIFAVFSGGVACALLDCIFWGGSLDYINVMRLLTFDLKDLYLFLFALLFIIEIIRNWNAFCDFRIGRYLRFCIFGTHHESKEGGGCIK